MKNQQDEVDELLTEIQNQATGVNHPNQVKIMEAVSKMRNLFHRGIHPIDIETNKPENKIGGANNPAPDQFPPPHGENKDVPAASGSKKDNFDFSGLKAPTPSAGGKTAAQKEFAQKQEGQNASNTDVTKPVHHPELGPQPESGKASLPTPQEAVGEKSSTDK